MTWQLFIKLNIKLKHEAIQSYLVGWGIQSKADFYENNTIFKSVPTVICFLLNLMPFSWVFEFHGLN